MEPKKPTTHYPPPPTQSQEEESGEGDEESEGEESASQHKKESGKEERSQGEEFEAGESIYESRIPHAKLPTQLNKAFSAQKKIVTPSQSSSDSGEEKEDDEGGDDEELEISTYSPSGSNFMIKFLSPTRPTSKDSNSTSKRPLEYQRDEEEHLRSEKKSKGKADEPKKDKPPAVSAAIGGGAGRMLWNHDEVKCLLRSVIDFKNEKRIEHSADLNAFYEYVEGKFQRKFTNGQIYEKIRGLNKKFSKSVGKLEKVGDGLALFNRNDLEIFELSKLIWEDKTGNGTTMSRANKTAKRRGKVFSSVKEDKKEEKMKKNAVKPLFRDDAKDDFQSKYPFLASSFDDSGYIMMIAGQRSFLKENMSLIDHRKALELEGEWKKMRKAEVELLLKRSELMTEQCSLVLEGMKEKSN